MSETFDVAIVGSGPSGAIAAFELSNAGLKVALIEREKLPRYKTCGGGLVFRGRRRLPFAVDNMVEKEFHSVEISFGQLKKTFTTRRDQPIVSMIMRDDFDNCLVEKALQKGLTLYQEEKLISLELGETTLLKTSKRTLQAGFVIAADGALSPTAKMAGWEETRSMCPALECEIQVPQTDFERLSKKVRFDVDVVPFGYGWCFPKKNHLSVGVGNFMKTKERLDLKSYYRTYLKSLQIDQVLSEEAHGFIIPVTHRTDGLVRQNIFLTGDAAGFADPVTAEGISNAILSGQLAAQAIINSDSDSKKAGDLYERLLEQQLLPELRTGEKLARLFYENKTLRNLGLKKFGQQAAEAMTDVFMGERSYPADYKASIRRRLGKVFTNYF